MSSASGAYPIAASLGRPDELLAGLRMAPGRDDRVTSVHRVPSREGDRVAWPEWVPEQVVSAWRAAGVTNPWRHQVLAAEHARAGRCVVLATGTGSGKSLGYLMPALSAILGAEHPGRGRGEPSTSALSTGRNATVLYLAPTKALAADQLQALAGLRLRGLRAATYDGDTPPQEREWVRNWATYVLTNPDMLHRSVLPGHARWAGFLRSLRYVVVDECHSYRGVFGSHVAAVLRRLRRICARYGADPAFVLASATVADPALSAQRLVGREVVSVSQDSSPRGEAVFALWEPPLTQLPGERGAPVRRSVAAEAADLLADLVVQDVRTLAFVRSRRGAETVALTTSRLLGEVSPSLPGRVAAYRAGYLPEERRELERGVRSGRLVGLAATNALELGVDISGLDAVLIAGWPGTRASLWQQAGRAGRAGGGALAVLIARDDPLDTYLVHHPEAVFGPPVEAVVLDQDNPHVLAPHLCAAAAELPLTEPDLELFGPATARTLAELVARGWLRRRPAGWFWTRPERPSDLADIRGGGGPAVRVVEAGTGRLLGTVDAGAAHTSVHEGAVYLHQGVSYLVEALDLDEAVALVQLAEPDYTTSARDVTDIAVVDTTRSRAWGDTQLSFGTVEVTNQVVSFLRKRILTGEVLGEEPLDLPPRHLRTRAVWWTVSEDQLGSAGLSPADVPGAAHAAEHAAIGLLPLFATCDRWDIGGVSTACHQDTGRCTVFVYDGHQGGAGFAERAYQAASGWLRATRDAIVACGCESGCPSCVQSPKCGNGNDPLDKLGAVRLLDVVLMAACEGQFPSACEQTPSADEQPPSADEQPPSAPADGRWPHLPARQLPPPTSRQPSHPVRGTRQSGPTPG